MRRQNIIFLSKRISRKGGSYHYEIIRIFQESHNIFLYGLGFDYYDKDDCMNDIIEKSAFSPDIIMIGTLNTNYRICYQGFREVDIPKIFFLNKEYQNLWQKLKFIIDNKIMLVATVLNRKKHLEWEKLTGASFIHIPFATDYNRFKPLDLKREYDFGFCGSLFYRYGIISRQLVKNYIFNQTDISKRHKILWRDIESSDDYFLGKDYVEVLNKCKIFLSTKSAIGIIGQRFYELSGTKTLIMCPEDHYDGIFKDGMNCVMYKTDLSDFGEKLNFYVDNSKERESIVDKAYKIAKEGHTWKNRLERIFNKWEKIR